jgi:hypothetical protein
MELIMDTNQDEERYFAAKKKVNEIRGFYGNLTSYVIVNLFLFALNMVTSPEHLWFFWPMLGWGIGVAIHGMKVFNHLPFFDKEWEERKIKEFIAKEEQTKNT